MRDVLLESGNTDLKLRREEKAKDKNLVVLIWQLKWIDNGLDHSWGIRIAKRKEG